MTGVHYEVAGGGVPLVLLHGIGSNSRSWYRQVAGLSDEFRVVAWDAPGFGKSADPNEPAPSIGFYVAALRSLLVSLSVDAAIVVGHSFGGIVAQEFYRSYPRCVRSLILADTTQGGAQHLEERLRMIRSMTPAELARSRAPRLLSKNAGPELVAEAIARMSEVRGPGYEFAALAMASADTRGVLDEIDVPLQMIWGVDDEITPVWEKWPPRAHVELIPDAGHLCYIEQPERFNALVRCAARRRAAV